MDEQKSEMTLVYSAAIFAVDDAANFAGVNGRYF